MIRLARGLPASLVVLGALALAGCAMAPPKTEDLPYRHTPQGTVVWDGEFEFVPPPDAWKLVQIEEGSDEFSFAFLKLDGCGNPCQSTFAFDEDPFGYARDDLMQRQREYFQRFLWASRVKLGKPKTRPIKVFGGDGLEAIVEGSDPVRKNKVWAKVIFGRRGERVVGCYMTQWRPEGQPFDLSDVEPFDRFVESFRFLEESFYQKL